MNKINGTTLHIAETLQHPIQAGDSAFTVHSLRYSGRERNWGCDTSYTTYVYATQVLTLDQQGLPYNPKDRALGTAAEPGMLDGLGFRV